jgi:Flp pilus assembly protein TadD
MKPRAAPAVLSLDAQGTKSAPAGKARSSDTPRKIVGTDAALAPSAGHLDKDSDAMQREPAISIHHGSRPPKLSPVLLQAWNAFQAGDMNASLAGYQRAAQEEPNNTDALHGLAAIALRQGRTAEATARYRHILDLTPQDALAQTSLASLAPSSAEVAESRLQSLVAKAPQSSAAHFSLGNLYAGEGRWADAEQAYFNALAAEPDNPDYRFNLAVSLDQLGQGKEAATHYRGALAQAAKHPANFDLAQALARLAELEP